jgi:sulfite oxidase
VLGDHPLVAETPEHLLNDDATPTEKLFIRNNGLMPVQVDNPDAWTIRVDGAVNAPLQLCPGDIRQRFAARTRRMVLECGGNGRAFFTPPARGNPWTNGGVGCAEWTGVMLKFVLQAAGLQPTAKFTGSHGADLPLSGDPAKKSISRGNPLAKSAAHDTARRAGASAGPRLARFAVDKMADPHPGPRNAARWRGYGRHLVSRSGDPHSAGKQP